MHSLKKAIGAAVKFLVISVNSSFVQRGLNDPLASMLAENWAFADFSSSPNSKTSLLFPI